MATDPTVMIERDQDGAPKAAAEIALKRWVIPYPTPSLNAWQSMHWGARSTVKQAWYNAIWGLQNVAATRVPPVPWLYCRAVIVFRRNAHRDLSNYDATLWKILPDALQHVGILTDDTERQMRRGPVTFQIDRNLCGHGRDPRQTGITVVAIGYPVIR